MWHLGGLRLQLQLLLSYSYWFSVFQWYACLKKSPVLSGVDFYSLVKICGQVYHKILFDYMYEDYKNYGEN